MSERVTQCALVGSSASSIVPSLLRPAKLVSHVTSKASTFLLRKKSVLWFRFEEYKKHRR